MRLVDADAYRARLQEVFDEVTKDKPGDAYAAGIGRAIYILMQEPSADVVDVVRCRDCEYWDRSRECKHSPGCYWCGMYGDYPSGESYCSEGVRKEQTDEKEISKSIRSEKAIWK